MIRSGLQVLRLVLFTSSFLTTGCSLPGVRMFITESELEYYFITTFTNFAPVPQDLVYLFDLPFILQAKG